MTGLKLVIIGAGGHGHVAYDIATLTKKYDEIVFLDDKVSSDIRIIGKIDEYKNHLSNSVFFVAIGNNYIRKKIVEDLVCSGAKIVTLIHPNSTIAKDSIIDYGTIVMAGAVINTGATIGKGVIVNTCSSVDHDCKIGNFSHISVGAHIAGAVTIGQNTFVGAGATVINNVNVCENCIIGAGGVVIDDITEEGTYVGVPVRKIKD